MEKDKRLMEASWWERVTEGGTGLVLFDRAILCVAQMVKRPPAMWETWVRSWVGKIPWRRERLPTPVFWPGEFHGLYSPWGRKESDTTERLSLPYAHMSAQHLTKSMS